MKIVIIGNGILGLTTAFKLLRKDPSLTISLIGPFDNKGCASLAAAAMFNSFAEIDTSTLSNKVELQKFLFNKLSTPHWPGFIKQLEEESGHTIESGYGTYIINNHITDSLEDDNFDAIVTALDTYNEHYELIKPSQIPKYKPSVNGRAARAMFVTNEGWVNPVSLVNGLKVILEKSGRVNFINGYCKSLSKQNGEIEYVLLENGEKVSGDKYILSPGATFSKILKESNLELNTPKIFYGVGCSILLKTGVNTLDNCVRTPNRGLACGVYSAPQNSTHTLIGASNFIAVEPEDYGRVTSVYTLLKSAMEQINTDYYRAELVKVNVGWRPTSADTLPLLGETSISNLLVATGTKRDGLHCSPVISDYLSDLILGNKPEHDLSLFKPERELVKFYTREDAINTAVRHSINAAYQHDFVPAKNRMVEDLEKHYYNDLCELHDKVGAQDWGIPPEMIQMYRYGHIV
jgi:glycine/D-amino acid oxidase-like deaminating enzyme